MRRRNQGDTDPTYHPVMGRVWLDRHASIRLRSALAAHDHPAIAVVGRVGCGKSTLVREVLGTEGLDYLLVTGSEALRPIPFGCVAGVLDIDPAPDLATALSRAHRALRDALTHQAALVLDDADLIDEATALLVKQVIDRRETLVVLIGPDVASLPERVHADLGEVIEVGDLDLESTRAFLADAHQSPVSGASVRALHRASQGNLLLLHRLDLAAGRGGAWARDDPSGLLVLASVPQPRDVAWRFEGYLRHLPEPVLRLIGLTAAGGPLDREDLNRLNVLDTVDAALRGPLVRYDADRDLVVTSHPLVVPAVAEAVGEWTMSRWCGEVVAARAERNLDAPGTLALAVLSLRGSFPLPVGRLIDAAWLALAFGAIDTAVRLAEAAVSRAPHPRSLLALAAAQAWGDDPAAARLTFGRIDSAALSAATRPVWQAYAAAHAFWGESDPAQAWRLLAPTSESPPLVRAMAASVAAFEGRSGQAVAFGEPVLTRSDAPEATIWAATGVSVASASLVDSERQAHAGAIGLAAADVCPSGLLAWSLLRDQVMTQLDTLAPGRGATDDSTGGAACPEDSGLAAARATARVARERAAGEPVADAISQALESVVATAAGEVGPARDLALSAWTVLRARAPRWWAYWAAVVATRATAVAGDAGVAAQLAVAARELFGPEVAVHEPDLLVAEGWAAWAGERISTARAAFSAGARLAASRGAGGLEVSALLSAWRTSIPMARSRTPRRLAGRSLAATVLVAADRGDAALAECAASLREAGHILLATEISESLDAPDRAAGMNGPVKVAADLEPWGELLPLTVRRRRSLSPLSHREREIAGAVRRGLTNAEIAAELGISVRTVEGHVLRATEKLGVVGRHGLRTAAHL